MKLQTEVISLTGIFIACAVSIGFVFAAVPNLELMTATIFLGGYILGRSSGLVIGFFSAFLWSSLNPWGSGLAYPALLLAQIIGFSAAGFAGGLIRLFVKPSKINFKSALIFALSGFILTIFYDVITNLSAFIFSGFNLKMLRNILIAGIPFSFFHIGINILIFFTVLPALIKSLNKSRFMTKYYRNDNYRDNLQ